jgi:hypothetical protein
MLFHSFYCTFSLLSPFDKAWSQILYSCSYNDVGCPVIEFNCVSKEPNTVGVCLFSLEVENIQVSKCCVL